MLHAIWDPLFESSPFYSGSSFNGATIVRILLECAPLQAFRAAWSVSSILVGVRTLVYPQAPRNLNLGDSPRDVLGRFILSILALFWVIPSRNATIVHILFDGPIQAFREAWRISSILAGVKTLSCLPASRNLEPWRFSTRCLSKVYPINPSSILCHPFTNATIIHILLDSPLQAFIEV